MGLVLCWYFPSRHLIRPIVDGGPSSSDRMRGPVPTPSPSIENKPTVKRCIDQIMRKSGLSEADAKLVLRHMVGRSQLVTKDGDQVTFEQMVRSQEWRHQLPLEPRASSNFMLNKDATAGAPWPALAVRTHAFAPLDDSSESLPVSLSVSPKESMDSLASVSPSASGDGLALLSSIASV